MTTVDVDRTAEGLRVVLVDPRPERRELMGHLVASTGLAATGIAEAASAVEAMDVLDREDRDVAVVEIQMPVSEGLKAIAALRGRSSGLRIVVCTFLRDSATKALALAEGADAYLDKPVNSDALKTLFQEFSLPRAASEKPGKPESGARKRPAASRPRRAKSDEA